MKRLLMGGTLAAVLAVTAACGQTRGVVTGQNSPGALGVASGRPAHSAPPPAPRGKEWLPLLSAGQVAAAGLLPRNWTLVGLSQNGTVAEVRYHFGGCMPKPQGALVTQSGSAVMLSLEAPRGLAADCAAVVATGAAWIHIPALAGRALRHAPLPG